MLNKDVIDKIIFDLGQYARDKFPEYAEGFVKDIKKFLEKEGSTIERWVNGIKDKVLKKEEFFYLLKGKKDVLELEILKQTGIAVLTAERMKNDILGLLSNAAMKYLGIPMNG